ncbi:MAG: right-handed parallel beta-helix repeat-containing protein, partial [bacterium]
MKSRHWLVILLAASVLLTAGALMAAGTSPPPGTVGPQTLAGFGGSAGAHEFLLQPGSSWKGDLTGIGAGPTWSLVVLGIDATGVTGPADRFIYFNLQDADNGSHFKNLGVNFYLDATGAAGGTLFQCYQQWTSEGGSSHGLNPGVLTANDFDLRFDFTKASTGDGWFVTPYYRLSGGVWTVFFGGSFTATVGGIDFDAGKLAVGFDGGADGVLTFDNYYLEGPPATTYVDDDWAGTPDGDPVQFPGETEYRTFGVDAFAAVQDGIDAVSGSTVNVAAGTYSQRLSITKSLELRGAQYGVDPTPTGARTVPANESVIDMTGLGYVNPNILVDIGTGVSNVTIDGFTLDQNQAWGNADECVVRAWDDYITLSNNIMSGTIGVIHKGNDYITVDHNRMTVNKGGVFVQPNAASNVTVSDNAVALGASPAGDESAVYMTGVNIASITGNSTTGSFSGRGIGGSNNSNVTLSGNSLTGHKDAMSFWGNTTYINIVDNDLSGSTRYGINIKGQDIHIEGNVISGCGDAGVNVDRHVIDTERVRVYNNDLGGNTNYGVQVNTGVVTETVDASSNWWGYSAAASVQAEANGGSGVDYTPWLVSGTNTGSGPGFDGDFSDLTVDDDSPQVGTT